MEPGTRDVLRSNPGKKGLLFVGNVVAVDAGMGMERRVAQRQRQERVRMVHEGLRC